mmetsp:Transcript_16285/g.35453  ORF Transcript_16285/g.35453 Transcript_16285/m.35453 type:complete len:83 (-) Transcript_16285:501-749(-)
MSSSSPRTCFQNLTIQSNRLPIGGFGSSNQHGRKGIATILVLQIWRTKKTQPTFQCDGLSCSRPAQAHKFSTPQGLVFQQDM